MAKKRKTSKSSRRSPRGPKIAMVVAVAALAASYLLVTMPQHDGAAEAKTQLAQAQQTYQSALQTKQDYENRAEKGDEVGAPDHGGDQNAPNIAALLDTAVLLDKKVPHSTSGVSLGATLLAAADDSGVTAGTIAPAGEALNVSATGTFDALQEWLTTLSGQDAVSSVGQLTLSPSGDTYSVTLTITPATSNIATVAELCDQGSAPKLACDALSES